MRTPRGTAVATLLAVLAMLLGACGSGGGTPAAPPTARKVTAPPASYVPSVKQPNVLVIEADDMRWDELKFMPHVRALIKDRGLTFENSFAPYPLCCPSRASFLTGKYAHNHHVLSHVDPFGFQAFDDRLTLATQLQGAGYQTALVGKYLNGYARQPRHDGKGSSLHYVPPGWTRWIAGSDHRFPGRSPLHGGTYNYMSMTQNIDGDVVPHRGVYSTDLLGQQVRQVLGSFTKARKPWFVWWTPVAPHFGGPKESDDPAPVLNAKGRLTKFETPARPASVRGLFDRQIRHALGDPAHGPAEADNSDKPAYLRALPEMNAKEKVALTEVSRQRAEALWVLDQQVGRTLARLRQTGQYDRTVIVFTSDNGYFLGEHRKPTGKVLPHEPSLRVPFLIAGPGVPHGRRYDPITTVDVAPTVMAYADGRGMPEADGTSLVPVIEKGDRGWTRPVVTEGLMGDRAYRRAKGQPGFDNALNTRGIRTARYKYVRYSTGEVELYDLKTDPLELESRQDDPAYAGIQRRLARLWTTYHACKETGCSAPLPKAFRATPAQERAITKAEVKRTRAYYGDRAFLTPPLR